MESETLLKLKRHRYWKLSLIKEVRTATEAAERRMFLASLQTVLLTELL